MSETARAANFSNEPGAVRGYRFLKNVPGFWLLERCASEWGDATARELLELGEIGEHVGGVFDVRENRFLAPDRMVAGPAEATALGNARLQGLSLGRFATLEAARAWAAADALQLQAAPDEREPGGARAGP